MSVDLTLAKAHLRVTGTAEDTIITQYIASSRAWIERYTGLRLEETEVVETFTEFGEYLTLTASPIMALVEIAYVDGDGDDATVDDARLQGNKVYAPTTGWPAIQAFSTITVTYDAGYDDEETPHDLIAAQLLLIGHWFTNREAVSDKTMSEVPLAVEALAGPFRLPTLR